MKMKKMNTKPSLNKLEMIYGRQKSKVSNQGDHLYLFLKVYSSQNFSTSHFSASPYQITIFKMDSLLYDHVSVKFPSSFKFQRPIFLVSMTSPNPFFPHKTISLRSNLKSAHHKSCISFLPLTRCLDDCRLSIVPKAQDLVHCSTFCLRLLIQFSLPIIVSFYHSFFTFQSIINASSRLCITFEAFEVPILDFQETRGSA